MRNLDIFVILNSGVQMRSFCENLLKIRNNSGDRLLEYIPIEKVPSMNLSKDPSISYSFEDFIKDPLLRISLAPKTENMALLVNEVIDSGDTIYNAGLELIGLGYKKEDIFSYGRHKDLGYIELFSDFKLQRGHNEIKWILQDKCA